MNKASQFVEPADKIESAKGLKEHQKMTKNGEMTFGRNGETLLVSWVDKKHIHLISIMCSAYMTEVANKCGRKNET
jgi:hypothetical protein